MLKKAALIAAAATSTLVALPSAAQAQYGYDYGRYERPAVNYDRYGRAYTYDRYGRAVYADNRYQSRNGGYYGQRSGGYYGQSNSGYYGRNTGYYGQRSCSGTTGTIVGGVAGALLGREVTRNSRGWNRNSGTTGAIIGGAIGALAGRAVDKSNC